jgi:inositol-phosphate phosphatase/L-galactose 1-phosphate phosphatase/histidinol-phosphatase
MAPRSPGVGYPAAMVPSDPLIALAHRLADRAGEVIRPWFRAGIEAEDKADGSPVTRADRDTEEAIRALLARHAPGHGIIGEELGRSDEGAELVWVLDPIDGTKAFLAGKPLFVTLVALLHRGKPVLGVIDQPVTGERWMGAAGRPTLFGGRATRARACAGLAGARLSSTGPQYFGAAELGAFQRVATAASFTSWGGDGYQYGLVASGTVDVVVESGLKIHDWAALVPVVTGAGGVITDWQGRVPGTGDGGDIVAAGDARCHAEALAALAGPAGG